MNSQEKIDAEVINKAIEGNENIEKTFINIAGKRTHKERMKIRHEYKAMFGKDLMSDINSELSSNFKKVMLALFTDPVEYDVDSIYKAISGAGTDEDTLIEILASRPSWYLNKIKNLYKEKYNKDLEKDIIGDISGDFRKLCVSIIQGKRSTNQNPNTNECERLAKELYEAGEKQLGTDEPVFNKIFALSSPHELIMISKQYHKLTGNLLTKAIDREFSGNIKKLLKSILYALISPSEYFSTRIHDAVDGEGTNERILTRIIVTRAEIDLHKIKEYYNKLYGKNMMDDIRKDISGDYESIIIDLCNIE